MTFKEKLAELKIENWYSRFLRLTHWSDNYLTHAMRYYNSNYFKKKALKISKKELKKI